MSTLVLLRLLRRVMLLQAAMSLKAGDGSAAANDARLES